MKTGEACEKKYPSILQYLIVLLKTHIYKSSIIRSLSHVGNLHLHITKAYCCLDRNGGDSRQKQSSDGLRPVTVTSISPNDGTIA